MKLTERFRYEAAFTVHYETIMQHIMEVISACEEGKISNEVLGHEEQIHLYTALSTFAPDLNQDEDGKKREQILTWALTRQVDALQNCPPQNTDKLCRIVATIKTITQGINAETSKRFI